MEGASDCCLNNPFSNGFNSSLLVVVSSEVGLITDTLFIIGFRYLE